MILFILFSICYVVACAVTDGAVNKLIFREHAKDSYDSNWKKEIFKKKEWAFIGMSFLIFIGVIAPVVASYVIGGFKYVFIFLAIECFISWDMIFGKIVFDDWFGDTPSIKLPWIGWIHMSLKLNLFLRLVLGMIFTYLAVSYRI